MQIQTDENNKYMVMAESENLDKNEEKEKDDKSSRHGRHIKKPGELDDDPFIKKVVKTPSTKLNQGVLKKVTKKQLKTPNCNCTVFKIILAKSFFLKV